MISFIGIGGIFSLVGMSLFLILYAPYWYTLGISNYIFNSTINGIEESDFILLVGTNPRLEATILNARIRKAYVKNKTKIYSIGDVNDLTYPYEVIGSETSIIRDIVQDSHKYMYLHQ